MLPLASRPQTTLSQPPALASQSLPQTTLSSWLFSSPCALLLPHTMLSHAASAQLLPHTTLSRSSSRLLPEAALQSALPHWLPQTTLSPSVVLPAPHTVPSR